MSGSSTLVAHSLYTCIALFSPLSCGWAVCILMVIDWYFGVYFFTALTMFLSSTAVVFLGRPVRCLLFSTPAVSFFFRTFQVVVQAIPNVCPMALINFPPFSKLKNGLLFSQRLLSGHHVGFSFLTQMQSSQAKPKTETKSRHSERFIV